MFEIWTYVIFLKSKCLCPLRHLYFLHFLSYLRTLYTVLWWCSFSLLSSFQIQHPSVPIQHCVLFVQVQFLLPIYACCLGAWPLVGVWSCNQGTTLRRMDCFLTAVNSLTAPRLGWNFMSTSFNSAGNMSYFSLYRSCKCFQKGYVFMCATVWLCLENTVSLSLPTSGSHNLSTPSFTMMPEP